MADSYDLSKLGPSAFENLVNFLAMKTLGLGATGFSPGSDGGRDGYFEGEAPYPSQTDRWKGVWYIQSKFHAPHLSTDPQKWLQQQVANELTAFEELDSDRLWPDNWIIVSNVDPSGKPHTGSFDSIRTLVKKRTAGRSLNLDIWGGNKIRALLAMHGDVARFFGHLLTPGHVVSELYAQLSDSRSSLEEIVRYFVVTQFGDQTFTKLDQAGSSSDVRPAVQDLFVDLPYATLGAPQMGGMLETLCAASAQSLRYSIRQEFPDSWNQWSKHPKRARTALIKGGPGQGKSTVAQYFCQIHRAALILASDGPPVSHAVRTIAESVRNAAQRDGFWPVSPRIPIQLELKEFAHWYSRRSPNQPRGVLVYLAESLAKRLGSETFPKTIKKALGHQAWIVVFDGLDEVPNDFKDQIAKETLYFLNDLLIEVDGDVFAICTSRPQGYSGQFSGIDGPVVDLLQLDSAKALECAKPVLRIGRTKEEYEQSVETLDAAIKSPNVKELMTTPLQSHIMAVVVRDGGRPPDKRWQLFNNFYNVMKKRESLKSFQNPRIARLLREEDRLLKSVHMYLGFILHARAERSEGAQTTLSRAEFKELVRDVVSRLVDLDVEETVHCVMEATTERLVLVSTPESGEHVRFDIRQLQEFFAAEFIYAGVDAKELAVRIETIGGDAHWREVVHFLLSALIENQRTPDLAVATQVLRRLNEGDEGSSNGLYHRRMCKGGWLACRLLIEGVLEPDQRDRQQIKPLFDTLSGVLDLDSLSELKRLRATRSRQWFVQLLADKLTMMNPTEYVGALVLLGWLLANDSVHGPTALQAFLNSSFRLQEAAFTLWTRDLDIYGIHGPKAKSHHPVSRWAVDAAFHQLSSSSWTAYSHDVLLRLLALFHFERETFADMCKARGLSESTTAAIQALIALRNFGRHRASQGKTPISDLGLLRGVQFAENWHNEKFPANLQSLDLQKAKAETGGIFQLMFTCLLAAKSRGPAEMAEFAKHAALVGAERLAVLPARLLALVPIGNPQGVTPYDVSGLMVSDTTVQRRTRMDATIFDSLTLVSDQEVTEERCKKAARKVPRIAIDLAFGHEVFSLKECGAYIAELTSSLDVAPQLGLRYILQWGYLQDKCPERLQRLKDAAREADPSATPGFGRPRLAPFMVKLPEEVTVLRLLGPALVEWVDAGYRSGGREHSEQSSSFVALLGKYGLDRDQLRRTAKSPEVDPTARAGALALFWLSFVDETSAPGEKWPELAQERELYAALATEFTERWLTRALVRGMLTAYSEEDPAALSFVTHLLLRCQEGSGPREEVSQLLLAWREKSLAPVHSRQVLQKWLGYAFQAPEYARY